jgi:hypothetical protein
LDGESEAAWRMMSRWRPLELQISMDSGGKKKYTSRGRTDAATAAVTRPPIE